VLWSPLDYPIGFLQYYETDKAPQGEWSDEPIGTVGIDYLIGEEEFLGKGYGSKIVCLLVDFIKSKNEYDYIEDKTVGFSSLASDGYLDFMFTHKDYQRHGVASNLIRMIERKAKEQGNDLVYSDVSITAKTFFEKHGYIVEKQQLKRSKNKELINFRMTKQFINTKK
jgi:GNAT superfamily N-acetyltransferase